MTRPFIPNCQTSEKSDNYENIIVSELSIFNLDIIWTDEFGITLKASTRILFQNVLSICRDENLFQVDYTFDLMAHYFPIFNKIKIDDKLEIKIAISKAIIEMAKCYNTENRSTIKHLKFVLGDDTVCINIRI